MSTQQPASNSWIGESNCNGDEEVAPQERFRDPESGVLKVRLTSVPAINAHIYPEAPASTPDGRLIVFSRRQQGSGTCHFHVANTQTRRTRQVTDESDTDAPMVSRVEPCMYYRAGRRIIRLCTQTFARTMIMELPEFEGITHLGTISDDGCLLAGSIRTGLSGALIVVDLRTHETNVIHHRDDAPIGHVQFSRNGDNKLFFQVNDGMELDGEGNVMRLIGERGASIHVIDVDGVHHHRLRVGFNALQRIQGHQCWLGNKDRVISTMHRRKTPQSPWIQDRIVAIGPGEAQPQIIAEGRGFTHMHTTRDGNYWVSDCNRTGDIFIGSVATGRYQRFVSSGATFGSAQYTHPHPFFTASDNAIGWNSDGNGGIPHIWWAEIPDGWLANLT